MSGAAHGFWKKKTQTRAGRAFWAIQIPYLVSPLAGYLFASGAFLYVTFQPFDLRFGFFWLFGSKFEFSLVQFDKPFVVGANAFAAAIYLFLNHRLRVANATAAPHNQPAAALVTEKTCSPPH